MDQPIEWTNLVGVFQGDSQQVVTGLDGFELRNGDVFR